MDRTCPFASCLDVVYPVDQSHLVIVQLDLMSLEVVVAETMN